MPGPLPKYTIEMTGDQEKERYGSYSAGFYGQMALVRQENNRGMRVNGYSLDVHTRNKPVSTTASYGQRS